jgi:hypothetical protein
MGERAPLVFAEFRVSALQDEKILVICHKTM